jgi:hypothetical protein
MSLTPHASIPPLDDGKPVLVVINDGWGVNKEDQYNAVFSADTPVYDKLKAVPGRFRTVQVRGGGDMAAAVWPRPERGVRGRGRGRVAVCVRAPIFVS